MNNNNTLTEYLGIKIHDLVIAGGITTAREIQGQPELWRKVFNSFYERKDEIHYFLKKNLKKNTKVILLGAGTSAFIGDILSASYFKNHKVNTFSIATTDLITHPNDYLNPDDHYLAISFARSGNSPESLASIDLINNICPNASHIIITCNANGELNEKFNDHSALKLVLPPESNDEGLAMTGSFTSMLLTGYLIANIEKIQYVKKEIELIINYGKRILNEFSGRIKDIADNDFNRVVFLGSGSLLGCARESHLKVQELTNGEIIGKYDSFLGFRHGPKVVINPKTVVICLITNDPHALKYDLDLIKEIKELDSTAIIGLTEYNNGIKELKEIYALREEPNIEVSEELLSVCYVLVAQLLGFYKSIQLNFKPDNPSERGVISRVVQGVNIYPFN